MADVALALSTKLAILDVVVARSNKNIAELARQLPDGGDLEEYLDEGFAFQPEREGLLFEVRADIDSFLFESRSVYEITGRFLREMTDTFLSEQLSEERMLGILEAEAASTEWIEHLRDDRILFFHNTAPWIAAEIVGRSPVRYELVVMKRNIENLSDPESFIRLERLRDIWTGYQESLEIIFRWFVRRVEEVEERDCA